MVPGKAHVVSQVCGKVGAEGAGDNTEENFGPKQVYTINWQIPILVLVVAKLRTPLKLRLHLFGGKPARKQLLGIFVLLFDHAEHRTHKHVLLNRRLTADWVEQRGENI